VDVDTLVGTVEAGGALGCVDDALGSGGALLVQPASNPTTARAAAARARLGTTRR